jgi:SAM-dependent methyltransferase
VYGRLAEAAVALVPGPLTDLLAIDAGAGTGAVARALVRRGARVVAVDRSAAMLGSGHRPAVVADVRRLPFASRTADLTAAGCVLSHVTEPGAVLAEFARVTRPGGRILVTAFPVAAHHPVKDIVDRVLAASGYRPPGWYVDLKRAGENRVGTASDLLTLAAGAGIADPVVDEVPVDLTGLDAAALVRWRLGMAQVAPYVAGLDPDDRRRLTAEVTRSVAPVVPAAPLPVLVLGGIAAG